MGGWVAGWLGGWVEVANWRDIWMGGWVVGLVAVCKPVMCSDVYGGGADTKRFWKAMDTSEQLGGAHM